MTKSIKTISIIEDFEKLFKILLRRLE